MRNKAWRNLMVAAINAGLQQRLFGLKPGENWWLTRVTPFRFEIEGCSGVAYVRDIGWDELNFHVAL